MAIADDEEGWMDTILVSDERRLPRSSAIIVAVGGWVVPWLAHLVCVCVILGAFKGSNLE